MQLLKRLQQLSGIPFYASLHSKPFIVVLGFERHIIIVNPHTRKAYFLIVVVTLWFHCRGQASYQTPKLLLNAVVIQWLHRRW